jgi:hypothetical protein
VGCGIEIVLAALIQDSDVAVVLRIFVGHNGVYLVQLQ